MTYVYPFVYVILLCYLYLVKAQLYCGDPSLVLLENNNCYFISEDFELSFTWDGAKQYCHLFSNETVTYDLLILDNDDLSELNIIQRYMQDKGYSYAYIDLTNGNPEGNLTDWRWGNGISFSLNSPLWSYGNPDMNSTTCGYIKNVNESTIYGLYERAHIGEFSCSYQRSFICEGFF